MEFKDNLYRIKKEKGMSWEELVALCDISRRAISKWEDGTVNPGMENLRTLSRSLRISIDELLGNKTPPEKEVVREREVVYVHSRYTYEKRYRPKLPICGISSMDISVGRGCAEEGYWRVAKGIIVIGNVFVGVISVGLLNVGLRSPGLFTLGLLFAIGPLALPYFATGCLVIGYISISATAIGVYSIGAVSIGFRFAIDAPAYGETAMGTNPVGDIVYHLRSSNTCFLDSQKCLQFQEYLSRESLPKIIEFSVQAILLC